MRFILAAALLTSILFTPLFAGDIKGSLLNGSTGKPGYAETLKIIQIGQGMKNIAEKKNVQGNFIFTGIQGEGPFLIQAIYQGVNYNQIVPPGTMAKPHKVTVYDKTDQRSLVSVKSLMQIVREKDVIRIFKLFVITNNSLPPRSFSPATPLEIYIPENAEQVFGQLTQGSGMGIPLELKQGRRGRMLDRAILPGTSELQVSFIIPAANIADASTTDELLLNDDGVRHIFVKPQDMKLEFADYKEAVQLKEDIPEGLNAWKITYRENTPLKISISGGSPVISANSKRVIVNGTFFDSWDRSALGLLAFIGILFTLSFLFIYKR